MQSRNTLLIRSVLFGLFTKLGGTLIVVLGLPVIGHQLTIAEYSIFLKCLSVSSLILLGFGVSYVISAKDLAEAVSIGVKSGIKHAERKSAGLFVLLFGVSALGCAVALPTVSEIEDLPVLALVASLALFQGLAAWGDAYRVALRTDHISSMWQLGGNLLMIGLLLAMGGGGFWVIIAIYFGIPVAIQTAILAHLWIEQRLRVVPEIRLGSILGHVGSMTPLVLNNLAEFGKIFGCGWIISEMSGDADYARYATLILLAARIVNPISLITRPFMPAYIDAREHGDDQWLRMVRLIFLAAATASLAGTLLLGGFVNPRLITWVLPPEVSAMTRLEIILIFLFVWGHGWAALLVPIFVAAGRAVLFSVVNAATVAAGLTIGALAAVGAGGVAVLAAVTAAATATAIYMAAFAIHRLIRARD